MSGVLVTSWPGPTHGVLLIESSRSPVCDPSLKDVCALR